MIFGVHALAIILIRYLKHLKSKFEMQTTKLDEKKCISINWQKCGKKRIDVVTFNRPTNLHKLENPFLLPPGTIYVCYFIQSLIFHVFDFFPNDINFNNRQYIKSKKSIRRSKFLLVPYMIQYSYTIHNLTINYFLSDTNKVDLMNQLKKKIKE